MYLYRYIKMLKVLVDIEDFFLVVYIDIRFWCFIGGVFWGKIGFNLLEEYVNRGFLVG